MIAASPTTDRAHNRKFRLGLKKSVREKINVSKAKAAAVAGSISNTSMFAVCTSEFAHPYACFRNFGRKKEISVKKAVSLL